MDKQLYERRIVAFLDILGFRSLVDQSGSDSGIQQQIASVLSRVDFSVSRHQRRRNSRKNSGKYSRLEKEKAAAINVEYMKGGSATWEGPIHVEDYMDVTSFSDSIVISALYDNDYPVSGLFPLNLIVMCRRISIEMLKLGFLVRGGIAIGKLLHDNNVAFGPAFLEAYDLERLHARWPRIIVAQSAEFAVEGMFGVERDDDGRLFVDVFTGLDVSTLRQHRETVARRASIEDSRIQEKWRWLESQLSRRE